MRFRKLGCVFAPDGSDPRAVAYAILPTPLTLPGAIRVFYASTDANVVGRIFWIDLDIQNPLRILNRSSGPILNNGSVGSFDEFGVNPISIVRCGPELRLYYAGYQRPGGEVPYTLFAGLAFSSDDGATFKRASDRPVLPPIPEEKFFRTAPNVHHQNGLWRAWYIGGGEWTVHDQKKLPLYGLRYAESANGIEWDRPRILMEPDRLAGQIGFGRPFVIKEDDGYRMFLSIRTVHGYSVSHARSSDGMTWHEWQHSVIEKSEKGWDSEMCCYAAATNVNGQEFVFYNGNGYGRSGFGIAVRES